MTRKCFFFVNPISTGCLNFLYMLCLPYWKMFTSSFFQLNIRTKYKTIYDLYSDNDL